MVTELEHNWSSKPKRLRGTLTIRPPKPAKPANDERDEREDRR